MKKDQNKFNFEIAKYLLSIGGEFETTKIFRTSIFFGAVRVELYHERETEILTVFCRNLKGEKDNFFSNSNRSDALIEFKRHFANLFSATEYGYVYQNEKREVINRGGFCDASTVKYLARQAHRTKARAYLVTGNEEETIIYLN